MRTELTPPLAVGQQMLLLTHLLEIPLALGFGDLFDQLLEGLTEFIPVSSTGHILLAGHFLGFDSPGKVFEVLIQLGAILAILSVYSAKLWRIAVSLPTDPRARRFVMAVLLALTVTSGCSAERA